LTQLTGTTHLRTTAYHPAANGMIERLHRQLKAAIKSHQTEEWAEILPVILLGIRAAWKEDLQATPAEMVYGETIRLPSQFLEETQPDSPGDDFAARLAKIMRNLRPTIKRHGQTTTFTHKDLEKAQQVFVRHDVATGALKPPYDGPYTVLNRGEKTFKLNIKGRSINVSKDRLKPAYMLETKEPEKLKETPEQTTVKTTRSGRTTKPPVRFAPGF